MAAKTGILETRLVQGARPEVLPQVRTELEEGVCTRALMESQDPVVQARALALFEQLTPVQRAMVQDKGGTARTFVISTPDLDRHRSKFPADAWDLTAYRENPVVLWSHRLSDLPLGVSNGAAIGADGKMRSTVVLLSEDLNPFAAQVDRLIEAGAIRGASIGALAREVAFVEDEVTGEWWIEFRKVELAEWSIVTVPSNRGAMLDVARAAAAAGASPAQARAMLQDFVAGSGTTNLSSPVEPTVVDSTDFWGRWR